MKNYGKINKYFYYLLIYNSQTKFKNIMHQGRIFHI